MAETPNYGLYLTPTDDTATKVLDLIQSLMGPDSESNMMKIDAAIAALDGAIVALTGAKADLVNGVVPLSQLPGEVKECAIAEDIAARDAIQDPFAGLNVYVKDAAADPTVNTGGAYYLYDGAAWIKTAEAESMDLVQSWGNITEKPEEFPPAAHTHDVSDVSGLDAVLAGKQNTITGTPGQVVGFNDDGLPVPQEAPSSIPPGAKGQLVGYDADGNPVAQGDSGTYYALCASAASSVVKEITIPNFTLVSGVRVVIAFVYAHTASSMGLSINGGDAVGVAAYGSIYPAAGLWRAGEAMEFVYNGSNWIICKGGIASATYYGMTKLSSSISDTSTTTAATPSAVKTAYDLANGKADKPKVVAVSLPVSGWDGDALTQTVTVPGILPPGSNQWVTIQPADDASYIGWTTYNVRSFTREENSLTFRAAAVPTAAINVEVKMENTV